MIIHSAKDLGALVRSERKARGWNQKELASRADVSMLWISQLERGKPNARFGLVLRTLKELQLDLRVGERSSGYGSTRVQETAIDLDAIIDSRTTSHVDG